MSLELWLGFVLASIALLIIPGPTIMLVVGRALSAWPAERLATVPGVALGDLTAITLSAAGLGAVLATSAALFTAVKLARRRLSVLARRPDVASGPAGPDLATDDRHGRPNMFLQAYTVTALNPKSIIFFVAFVPQFLSPAAPLPVPAARADPDLRRAGSAECHLFRPSCRQRARDRAAPERAALARPAGRQRADRRRCRDAGLAQGDVNDANGADAR